MPHSILASQKIFIKIVGFIEEKVTTGTPEAFDEVIYSICMKDMIVKFQSFDCFYISVNTSSS